MERLGRLVRLQVQVARLKRGEPPHRWYDAERIRRVPAVTLSGRGVVGLDGDERVVDNHHVDHPDSRHRGDNGISLGVTGHYERLRRRFGPRLTDGAAGENLILEHEGPLTADDLADGISILAERPVVLLAPEAIEPCVEFSRWVVGPGVPVREPLRALRGGMRGFRLTLAAGAGVTVREGDPVALGRAD